MGGESHNFEQKKSLILFFYMIFNDTEKDCKLKKKLPITNKGKEGTNEEKPWMKILGITIKSSNGMRKRMESEKKNHPAWQRLSIKYRCCLNEWKGCRTLRRKPL